MFNRFYYIYRYTNALRILNLLLNQIILFTLSVFAFSGLFPGLNLEPILIFKMLFSLSTLIAIVKLFTYYSIKKFRSYFGGNYRKTIIIGSDIDSQNLELFFNSTKEAGYLHKKTFLSLTQKSLDQCLEFVKENEIDEIYSSVAEMNNKELLSLIDYADNNLKILKFLPDNKEIYSKKLDFTYYGVLPILSMRKIATEEPINQFIKRSFRYFIFFICYCWSFSLVNPSFSYHN